MTTDADPEAVATASRYALQQAIRSGPNLAEVMYAKGYVKLFLDWNAPAAEAAARQAVTLDLNNALSHMFLGVVLSQIDNHVEARTMIGWAICISAPQTLRSATTMPL
jgi:Flp pilus assembly protein TadD